MLYVQNAYSKTVVIKTKNGRKYSKYLEYPKGHPNQPMTPEELENKFNSLSSEILTTERQKEIKELVFNCEKYDARTFMKSLVI